MENFMNEPTDYRWTVEDIVGEFNTCQDKKTVARIYCISTKEVTEILKRAND